MTPKAPAPAPAPKQPDPVRVPTPFDPDVIEAQKRKMQEEFAKRKGRASTDLTTGGNNAAGASYGRTTLG